MFNTPDIYNKALLTVKKQGGNTSVTWTGGHIYSRIHLTLTGFMTVPPCLRASSEQLHWRWPSVPGSHMLLPNMCVVTGSYITSGSTVKTPWIMCITVDSYFTRKTPAFTACAHLCDTDWSRCLLVSRLACELTSRILSDGANVSMPVFGLAFWAPGVSVRLDCSDDTRT